MTEDSLEVSIEIAVAVTLLTCVASVYASVIGLAVWAVVQSPYGPWWYKYLSLLAQMDLGSWAVLAIGSSPFALALGVWDMQRRIQKLRG